MSVTIFDPLAQSFYVKDEITYISAVGLYFATVGVVPFTVEIRNMVNGQPGGEIYLSRTLQPSDITASSNSSVETVFTFNRVVGFTPGEWYSIVAHPEGINTGYNLYAVELGQIDLISEQQVITHYAEGVLFHSPNGNTWESWTTRDLKYKLYKSNFENDCQIVWTELTGLQASQLVLAVEQFIAPGTNAIWSYSVDSGTNWIPFNPGVNTALDDIITKIQLRVDVTSLGGAYFISYSTGIMLLYHDENAYYVGTNGEFSDALSYPNKVTCYLELDVDGTNGEGVRSITPMFSVDDGDTWVEIGLKEGYTPVPTSDPWFQYQFETPDEATISGATNAEPIVVTSNGHGFKNNAIIDIADAEGNTAINGQWRVTNATEDTFELYTVLGVASVGSGAYTTGGTINMAEFSEMRPLIYGETTNRAVSPRLTGSIGFIASRVE